MKSDILLAYTELNNLNKGHVYSIAQINWWLLKYSDLYKNIIIVHNQLCDICLELKSQNLFINCLLKPNYCNKREEYQGFIKFYDELDQVTELHKLEEKCYLAYDEYTFLQCINEDLRNWVIKHYGIYEKLGIYFFRYLEFNSKDDKKLHIAEAPDETFGISIQEEDYFNSIKFYDVYYDLYENKKLYPEKIKEWDEVFAKIEYPKDEL